MSHVKFLDINWSICLNTSPTHVFIQQPGLGDSQVNNTEIGKDSWCPPDRAGWAGSPTVTLGWCLFCTSLYCQQNTSEWVLLREKHKCWPPTLQAVMSPLFCQTLNRRMRERLWAQHYLVYMAIIVCSLLCFCAQKASELHCYLVMPQQDKKISLLGWDNKRLRRGG